MNKEANLIDFRMATLKLQKNGKPWKTLKVIHNLPDTPGLNMDGCLDNWIARTDIFTDQSLVDYINSKSWAGMEAFTIPVWEMKFGKFPVAEPETIEV